MKPIRRELTDHIEDGCAVHSTEHTVNLIIEAVTDWLDHKANDFGTPLVHQWQFPRAWREETAE